MRYPMVSRMALIECGGNGALLASKEPLNVNVQALHGLPLRRVDGVMLSTLLDEKRHRPQGEMADREGARSLAVSRSVPMQQALDDAMIALYQNGERLMPAMAIRCVCSFPAGKATLNIKSMRRLKLADAPAKLYEARTYSQILPGGKAFQFYHPQEEILHHPPSPGLS